MILVVFIDGKLKYCIDITQQDGFYLKKITYGKLFHHINTSCILFNEQYRFRT